LATADKTFDLPAPAIKVVSASGAEVTVSSVEWWCTPLPKAAMLRMRLQSLVLPAVLPLLWEQGSHLCQLHNVKQLYHNLLPAPASLDILPLEAE